MMKMTEQPDGLLYLEDGSVFRAAGFGATGTAVGELVFNTSMTGYQEILTDPSCEGQILTMTYPLIGNYGVSAIDDQSDRIHAFGLVIRDLCEEPSNALSEKSLDQWMKEQEIPGIFGLDTRQITRKLRKTGTQKALISTEGITIAKAREILASGEMKTDGMKNVSVKEKTVIQPCPQAELPEAEGVSDTVLDVAVLDFGARRSVLDGLCMRNCRLTLYPYGTKAEEIMADEPDGIFLTNGPGDPKEAEEAAEEVRRLIHMSEKPVFGVGLGHQILAIALGGRTAKMTYGHRGGNHGVFDKETKRSDITAQNHGYEVLYDSIILKGMEITHLNLNDGSVEGMEHRDYPVFSVQFLPETAPGSVGSARLYDRFIQRMKEAKAGGEE